MAGKEVSACCEAAVEYGRTRAGETSPPEPFAVCSECGRQCDTVAMPDEDEDDLIEIGKSKQGGSS